MSDTQADSKLERVPIERSDYGALQGGGLDAQFGSEIANTLTAIYSDLLETIQQQRSLVIVPRHLRLRIVHALISEVEQGETDTVYLKDAALVAVARYDEHGLEAEA